MKGGIYMATSSITKNFVVCGDEQVEIFANAIEESANEEKEKIEIPVTFVKGSEAIVELLKKWEKRDGWT